MAEQRRKQDNRPETPPDPARSYERARPEDEAGMGRLDAPQAIPEEAPDKIEEAVPNEQTPKQINADDTVDERATSDPAPEQPDHSMHEEEPLGWDQAPTDIQNPRAKRHPRTEGKGGVH
jgi:hypothetical protein